MLTIPILMDFYPTGYDVAFYPFQRLVEFGAFLFMVTLDFSSLKHYVLVLQWTSRWPLDPSYFQIL